MTPTRVPQPRLKYSLPAAGPLPFVQQVTLIQDGQPIGQARWHATESGEGVFQLLDLSIAPEHQRSGHGSTLLRAVYDQATTLFKSLGIRPRRVWVSIEQKRHVI